MSFTFWFTGLPAAGKTTIATEIETRLKADGYQVVMLDGDIVRTGINSDLGFSRADIFENLRRIAYICKLLNSLGFIVLACFVSPYQEARDKVRSIVGDAYREIYIKTLYNLLTQRDYKDIYSRFTIEYEIPKSPNLSIENNSDTTNDCVEYVFTYIKSVIADRY